VYWAGFIAGRVRKTFGSADGLQSVGADSDPVLETWITDLTDQNGQYPPSGPWNIPP